ncbi:uncharacterized protein LTR77_010204 [Saxophila tyrrhenica]|uniref:Uncharacterized protein n=1 Tax=Saxophila tyrrhenica TaxID=1690608 RepID=A0AAV9P058_9PEZI|nr:hypothetical protein LTR77_010204 [Saxophila tyrrhenica]
MEPFVTVDWGTDPDLAKFMDDFLAGRDQGFWDFTLDPPVPEEDGSAGTTNVVSQPSDGQHLQPSIVPPSLKWIHTTGPIPNSASGLPKGHMKDSKRLDEALLWDRVVLGEPTSTKLASLEDFVDGETAVSLRSQTSSRRLIQLEQSSRTYWPELCGPASMDSDGFEPIGRILKRLTVGSRQISGDGAQESILSKEHRMINSQHPGPNRRVTVESVELRNRTPVTSTGESLQPILYDLTCNPLDGVIVLLKREDLGSIIGTTRFQTGPDMHVMSDITMFPTLLARVWRQAQSRPTGNRINNASESFAWLWDWTDEGKRFAKHDSAEKAICLGDYQYHLRNMGATAISLHAHWLNYVFVTSIQDEFSIAVIRRCLDSRDVLPGEVPEWDVTRTGPGRQTFQLGHWANAALLSLPTCRDVAWFLILHKGSLGHKVISSITIFLPTQTTSAGGWCKGHYNMRDWPCLLLEIKDIADDTMPEATKVRNEWRLKKGPAFPNVDCPPIHS